MAKVYPELASHRADTAGLAAELDVVRRLRDGLSDAFNVFHGVDWSSGSGDRERHGELDVVVVNQAGDILAMEVKSGMVEFRPDGIHKRYGAHDQNVLWQVKGQYSGMRSRLERAGLPVRVHHLLVLTDVKVQSETAQWPRERIVDADELDGLTGLVLHQLGPGIPAPQTRDRVVAFLENRIESVPDVSAFAGRLRTTTTRLSAGLATWVPRITVPSGVLRVNGTAGSGKTQLALRLLRDAAEHGERATYICFNRALADHISRLAPVVTAAETFHEYALRICRGRGMEIDFSAAGTFERIAAACLDTLMHAPPDLDLLVLDEVQDMQPEWVEGLMARLRPAARAVLMEDPNQSLYPDRMPFEIAEAGGVTSFENFRSPRQIVAMINLLGLSDHPIEALSAFEGEPPEPIEYEDEAGCVAATEAAVQRCLDRGFGIDDVAVVSLRGRERSVLLNIDRLGRHAVRRFSGRFDEGGAALWTEGDLLLESVRRFKGQAAAAVVLTECDFEALDPLTRRLLFVGMTRASMHLEWVISRRAAQALRNSI